MTSNFNRVKKRSKEASFRVNGNTHRLRSTIMNTYQRTRPLRNDLRRTRTNFIQANMTNRRTKNRPNITVGSQVNNGPLFLRPTNASRTLPSSNAQLKEANIKRLLRKREDSFRLRIRTIRGQPKSTTRVTLRLSQYARTKTYQVVIMPTQTKVRKDRRRRTNQVIGNVTNTQRNSITIFRQLTRRLGRTTTRFKRLIRGRRATHNRTRLTKLQTNASSYRNRL